jgi:hypothetical protein
VLLSADAYAVLANARLSFTGYSLSGPARPDDLVDLINDRARDNGRPLDL